MERVIYGISSYKRPKKQATLDMLEHLGISRSDIILCVQTKADYDEYKTRYSSRAALMYMPGDNLADNRNNILSKVPDGARVILMDDDIRRVVRMIDQKTLQEVGTAEEWNKMIAEGYEAATGFHSIGFSVYPVSNAYFMRDSISPRALGEGTFLGLTKVQGLRFDRHLPVREDYDMSCRIIKKYGSFPRLNMYACDAPHFNSGGCREWWDDRDLVRKVSRTLVARYPDLVALRKGDDAEIRFKR